MSAVVLFVLFFVILLFGLPISVTMGISSILPWVVDNTFAANLVMVLRQMMSGVNSLTLLAIPMFMLSGTIMARGGISKKLFDVFTYFVGNVIGGVPCAVIITCLFYGAISGSAPATVAAVGAMTIPVMVNLGYSKEFSTAVVTVAGGLGWHHPPQHPLCAVQHLGGHLRGRYVHCRHRAGPAAGRPADDLCGLLLRPQRGGPGAHQGGDGGAEGTGIPPAVPGQLLGAAHPGHHPGEHLRRHRHSH